MHRANRQLRAVSVAAMTLVGCAGSVSAAAAAVPESAYSALSWRFVGPLRAGWATVSAGVPGDPATAYLGGADGGVWKTDDAGRTWEPLFDHEGSASIGALAVAPSDPNVVWVGTGQINQRWDIAAGDGVYRSTDAGKTWTHVGLEGTRHVGRIWVDPRDANVALVAAMGHMFGPNDERGVYRTEDGGRTWTKVLFRDADTGGLCLAADPALPDAVYASLWQVRRYPWLDYFQPPVGPGSGIYKSNDGGRTWQPAGTKGLPKGPLGRIELGVAPRTSARRVWAAIDTPDGGGAGLYRSDDGGDTWALVNDTPGLAGSYMAGVTPHPTNPDELWLMGRSMRHSTDGGKTVTYVKGSPGGDDYHFLWVDPKDPRHRVLAADQGAAITLNDGDTWSSWYNQGTGQLYRLVTDDRFPYWIYAGQQDNGTVALASRSDYGQLTSRDWHPVGGDERDGDVPDPTDPGIVYGAGLGGRLSRWVEKTAQAQNVSPWPVVEYGARPGTVRYRYPWITPLAISSRLAHAIYMAAQVVFRSTDAGRSWKEISPDLTGTDPAAKDCQGDIPVNRATACGWGVVFAVAPSPAADGLIWAGTDNGHVQLTRDDGAHWENVTPPDMADWTKVNIVDPSPTDPSTAYVAADRHRLDDLRPLAWRTHDFGKTWTEIGHGLPDGAWVGVVRQDPNRPGLLFAGTNRGVQVSFDDGDHWQSLQLGLPTTGINDMRVHGDDVIVATQGRGIWSLDAIEPLRHLPEAALDAPVLLPPPLAYRLRSNQNKDTPLAADEPRAENPPVGAVLDYVLPAKPAGPVALEIADAAGHVVRRLASDDRWEQKTERIYFPEEWDGPPRNPTTHAGHNRFVWDLRLPAPEALAATFSIAALPGDPTPALPQGAFILPGDYEVRLIVDGRTSRQPLHVVMDPRVEVERADLESLLAFQQEVAGVLKRSAELAEARDAEQARLREWLKTLSGSKRKAAERSLAAITALAQPTQEAPERVNEVLSSVATDLEGADAAPTQPQRDVLATYRANLDRYETRWKALKR